MKRSIFIVIALVLSSVLLVACSMSGTNNEGTPMGTQTNELGTPVAGFPGTTTEPFTSTTPLVTQPLETVAPGFGTPALNPTETVTTTVSGGSALGNRKHDAGLVSNLLNFDVQDKSGEKIGTVSNLILNLESNRVQYIIINIGGALGIGGEKIAVPSALFEFPTKGAALSTGKTGTPVVGTPSTTRTNDDMDYLILKVDKAALENAPKWSDDSLPAFGQPAAGWDNNFATYWKTYNTPGAVQTTPPAATPGMAMTPMVGMTPYVGTTPAAPVLTINGKLQGVILADKVIGMNIGDSTGNKIAEIKDIVIDTTNWKIMYLIVEYSGANTSGTLLIPVPPAAFTYDVTGETLVIANADTMLTGAPHFTYIDFPSTATVGWDKDIKAYWNKMKTIP